MKRHTEEEKLEKISKIKEMIAGGMNTPDACKENGISAAGYNIWRRALSSKKPKMARARPKGSRVAPSLVTLPIEAAHLAPAHSVSHRDLALNMIQTALELLRKG